MAWEINKEYRTRKGEPARFLGVINNANPLLSHVFAVTARVGGGEQLRSTNENGQFGAIGPGSEQYRQHDVISNDPTPSERATIDQIRRAVDGDDKALLDIIRRINF